jgi:hypothetical protein
MTYNWQAFITRTELREKVKIERRHFFGSGALSFHEYYDPEIFTTLMPRFSMFHEKMPILDNLCGDGLYSWLQLSPINENWCILAVYSEIGLDIYS